MKTSANTTAARDAKPTSANVFERPSIESISLSCEISAYAAEDEDRPLF